MNCLIIRCLPDVAVTYFTSVPCGTLSIICFRKDSCLSFHLTQYWFVIFAALNGLPSGLRTWALCLLAALAVWVPLSFIPLIVELFCVIDKLQVWYSEEGWGHLSVNGSALGYKSHLDSSIETILCSGRCVLED